MEMTLRQGGQRGSPIMTLGLSIVVAAGLATSGCNLDGQIDRDQLREVEVVRFEPDLGWLEVGHDSGEVLRLELQRGQLIQVVADELLPAFPTALEGGTRGELWMKDPENGGVRWSLLLSQEREDSESVPYSRGSFQQVP